MRYFGYGSNMDLTSLRAKGVEPLRSTRARLPGWALRFNVAHYFRHEGGVGNIVPTGQRSDVVVGVVHECRDEDLAALDLVEAYGVGYDRVTVDLETEAGSVQALAYVGIDSFIDESCLPTRRYLNILVKGAQAAGIDPAYVAQLDRHPVHENPPCPPFSPSPPPAADFDAERLAAHPTLTALAGWVFDMAGARWQHEHLVGLFGGRDMTLWHLKRMDRSDGSETLEDVREGRLDDAQRAYLNQFLDSYDREYTLTGRFRY